MSVMRQVSQALENEHRSSLGLLEQVEQACVRGPSVMAFAPLASAFLRLLEHDIARHFDFEEGELFPRMAAAGESDIAALLQEEHDTIRELAAELMTPARAAAAGTLDEAGWRELRRGALEMVERQLGHIQKETMALLPLLDDLLDDDTDRALAFAYGAH